jgi:hypothetical protein
MRITAAVVHERSGAFTIEQLDLCDPRDDELLSKDGITVRQCLQITSATKSAISGLMHCNMIGTNRKTASRRSSVMLDYVGRSGCSHRCGFLTLPSHAKQT